MVHHIEDQLGPKILFFPLLIIGLHRCIVNCCLYSYQQQKPTVIYIDKASMLRCRRRLLGKVGACEIRVQLIASSVNLVAETDATESEDSLIYSKWCQVQIL